MPFTFIEIEKRKSRVIVFAFFFLMLIYFFTAYLLLFIIENWFLRGEEGGLLWPSLEHSLYALVAAVVIAFVHWLNSTDNLIFKLSSAINAVPLDPKDIYHQYLQNIVDEVAIATGGKRIKPMVIPSAGMNAFALDDFAGHSIIGVTEGLLARLNRSQIEAVVAHEAAHIASGDCFTTTLVCSLGELYEVGVEKLKETLGEKNRGSNRGVGLIILIYIVLVFTNFLSKTLRCFISRASESRADAIAVKLVRNPLSLAEALKLISQKLHSQCGAQDSMQSIFIISPQPNSFDEKESLLANLFSTHPPIKNRVGMLLAMAHLDEKSLDENLKNFVRVSPVAKPVFSLETNRPSSGKWSFMRDGVWNGPFSFDELNKISGILPTQWFRAEGAEQVGMAFDFPELMDLFGKNLPGSKGICPNCKVALQEFSYEGVPVLRCNYCEGYFVDHYKINRLLIRQDYAPSPELERLAKLVVESRDKMMLRNYKNARFVIECPLCKKSKMSRQFFVYSYPVEIDRCTACSGVWFDKTELEVLQYIHDNKETLLYKDGAF